MKTTPKPTPSAGPKQPKSTNTTKGPRTDSAPDGAQPTTPPSDEDAAAPEDDITIASADPSAADTQRDSYGETDPGASRNDDAHPL